MKRLLTAVVAASLLVSAHARANPIPCGGTIVPSADARWWLCTMTDTTAGLMPVYLIQTRDGKGAHFCAPKPDCFVATYLYETIAPGFTAFGDTQTGLAIGQGECMRAPFLLATIWYQTEGLTRNCCMYVVEPDPNNPSGAIEVFGCSDELIFGDTGYGPINYRDPCWVPVETTSWGRVKALYGP